MHKLHPADEYRQSISEYFAKHDPEGFAETKASSEAQGKRLEKLRKILKGALNKDLSPSGGIALGVPVRMESGAARIYIAE